MPSILDYLDNPQFLSNIINGGTADSFGPNPLQPPQPQPPPPPPEIMAQAPKQFGPGAAVDGGTGPADSFAARFSPGPQPISMPEPTKAKYEGGIFGGLGFKPLGWDDQPSAPGPQQSPGPDQQPGSALAFAGAPQTRNGFPYEAPPGVPSAALPETGPMPRPNPLPRDGDISVNRTPRNGMSLDDMQMSRPAPVGAPMDIRSAAQSGQPAPRIDRARAFGNFMASLGHGLTAVGNQKPGTTGAASFAGGMGGALTGGVENERHNLDRDEKGLDRAERGRERDQTFDYQNRTLAQNTKYHDDLVEQHRLDRGDRTEQHIADREARANAERYTPVGQDADGRIIYSDRNHPGREILGENKAVSRTGAGNQGGANERLARIIQAEHGKDADGNFKITMEEANNRARSAPKDSADLLRRETLARRDLKEHEERRRRDEPRKTLEDFRRELGLPPAPNSQFPPSPNVRLDPDRRMPLPPPSGPATPTPAAPGKITPFFTPQAPPPALPGPGMAPPGTPPIQRPGPNDLRQTAPPGTQAPPAPPIQMPTPPSAPVPGPIAGRNLTAGGPGPTPTPAPPFNPGPLPPAVTAGPPALSRPPLPGPGAGAPPSVPPAATPPGMGMNATKSEVRSGPTPPRPPAVPPGSQYSPSRNAWRAPDGTIIPGAPPQQ